MEKYLKFTKSLLKEFDNSKTNSLEIKVDGYSLSLSKGIIEKTQPAINESSEEKKDILISKSVDEKIEEKSEQILGQEIKSPLVGVYYAAKDPESSPFVSVGDKVKKGDVLCILESMKMMNEVKAPFSGIIRKICCENEELIEFNQVLFVVEKIND